MESYTDITLHTGDFSINSNLFQYTHPGLGYIDPRKILLLLYGLYSDMSSFGRLSVPFLFGLDGCGIRI